MPDRIPALLGRARQLLRLPGGPAERLSKQELPLAARAVEALHQGLVGTRALAHAATYDDPRHLGAYLLWWWPQTYAKVQAALRLTLAPLAQGPVVRVLDLGAGPGPGALALLDALGASGARVEALCVDASAAALSEAVALGGPRVAKLVHDLGRGPPEVGPFDLVLLSNALSELRGDAASKASLLEEIAARTLAPHGALIVLEPALKETGRALLEVRDRVVARGALKARAPCFTQRPCPALEHPRDWCTVDVAWTPPAHVVQLAQALGLHADAGLSFAPLVLSREVPAPQPGIFRVVGVPPEEKGKRRLFVCSDAGRVPVARLHAHESPANAPFALLARGDVVRLSGLEQKGDGLRVTREAQVERLPAAEAPVG